MDSKKIVIDIDFDINSYYPHLHNEDCLFFDIETTGLSAKNSFVFLIGCMFFENNNWYIEQSIINDDNEEEILLSNFINRMNKYRNIITYNGNSFDLPFITKRASKYNLILNEDINKIDLYRIITRDKHILNLKNYKLETVEQYMGIYRTLHFSGEDITKLYDEYTFDANMESYDIILSHNYDDVISLISLAIIPLHIKCIKNIIADFKIHSYTQDDKLMTITLENDVPLPLTTTITSEGYALKLIKDTALFSMTIDIINDTLLYFFENYKDYYYIKDRDEAIHKSIADFIVGPKKTKAKASNCYIKKTDAYIPAPSLNNGCKKFNSSYKSKDKYHLLNDIISDKQVLHKYTRGLIISTLNVK